MASGLEIFIIIFILLLVITGIILAIYFVWRNDQKKREGDGTESKETNPKGTESKETNPKGIDDPNGFTGFPNGSNSFVWNVYLKTVGHYLTLGPTSSTTTCKDYLFKLSDPLQNKSGNSLIWQGDTTLSICVAKDDSQYVELRNPNSQYVDIGNPNFGFLPSTQTKNKFNFDWCYDNTKLTWCLVADPNICMQSSGTKNDYILAHPLPTNFSTISNTDPTKSGFLWNNGKLPDTNTPCTS